MGATCSKKIPDIDFLDRQPPDLRLHLPSPHPWPSILLANSCVVDSETKAPQNDLPIDGCGSAKLEAAKSPARKSLGYRLLHDSSFERDKLEEKQNKRLSRAISRKANFAKTKTRTVAKRGVAKVSQVGFLLGRAGTTSLEMAIEALDTVGSSLTTLGAGFTAGVSPKARKIGILAFEVANTVVKGYDLLQTLSEDGIKMLKDEVLSSEGIQHLISKDMDVLWGIVAADKRNELRIYIQEVVRFGNHCRDPRWHQLSRFFERLDHEVVNLRLTAKEIEVEMDRMAILAQDTAELYHELHALDRLRNDLHRKLQQKENLNEQGEIVTLLKSDVKSQFKHVKILKKRSLWCKILEEVMESLVNIAFYLHQRINDEFGPARVESPRESVVGDKELVKSQTASKLGDSGLSLHYANMINQIHNLASRPSSIPPSSRDNLYQGLPPHMKASLRVRLSHKSEVTVEQIKAEMEKILEWLVPLAINTTRAHHGFGWVGEWAMKGVVLDRNLAGNTELALIQTLHHADQTVTEAYISDLIVCLHLLVSSAKSITSHKSPKHSPMQTLAVCAKVVEKLTSNKKGEYVSSANLSQDDQEMLQDAVNIRKKHPGISKSQEFDTTSKFVYQTLSKSNSLSPGTSKKTFLPCKRPQSHAFLSMDLDIDRIKDFEKDGSGKIYHS